MIGTTTGNGTVDHRRQEVQQAVKNACDQLNSDGVTPRDYVEQLAWLFFLKAFDEIEQRREDEAAFEEKPYTRLLNGEFQWSEWSKKTDRPDEMLEFVNGRLWGHLQNLEGDGAAERIKRIFSSVKNHSRRGASFARVVQQINRLHFSDDTDVIVLSEIYEDLLKRVAGDSAGYAGEFYTQRHLIRAMVQVVRPKMGDRIYDPCFGTAGFLAESAEYIRQHHGVLSGGDLEWLNDETFFGVENKPLTYLLGTMNMLLHLIEGARLEQANTLEIHASNVPEKHRYSVILANPPYGGKMAKELQTNFTIKSGSTEILFLQHIMANLAKGGRAGVIVPEGVLFRGGPDAKVRERLLTEFDVHTVLSLPAGCFLPYTAVKTSIVFFDRRMDGKTTESVWYYDLKNDGFELQSTRRPIPGEQISDFLSKWETRIQGNNSWLVTVKELQERNWDLLPKNPNTTDDYEHRPALELIQGIKIREERIVVLLGELEESFGGKL
ncbi:MULTISPECIES: type I restriction-modification system subunit M [Calothrix]|uniref:site-specific DNA-methyltransferase (adenine-specific) n=2 Tax=Calothrix TaxID=1186 RepID=A0ABR8A369_9CYAN|nr:MULTISPECIES: class I SAM-dependent DNA methyltransferase [Calothrix]MBD2194188.1 SAM-dependent DNA methyltransferase [Calothrix parietina FACHB-288]MBD2224984.1 SAM-dependent DNA methyltransferase [Calothrix anomala FACHB-343]